MKRLLVSLGLVVALTLLPARAASADILDLSAGVFPDDELAALSSSGKSFAVGGGRVNVGTHFAFSAHCKSVTGSCIPIFSETAPSGYAVVRDPALGEFQGHVCAYDSPGPNVARIWIVVEKGSGAFSSFPVLLVSVQDGGPSGFPDSLVVLDEFVCGAGAGAPITGGAVVQGNIVVKQQ